MSQRKDTTLDIDSQAFDLILSVTDLFLGWRSPRNYTLPGTTADGSPVELHQAYGSLAAGGHRDVTSPAPKSADRMRTVVWPCATVSHPHGTAPAETYALLNMSVFANVQREYRMVLIATPLIVGWLAASCGSCEPRSEIPSGSVSIRLPDLLVNARDVYVPLQRKNKHTLRSHCYIFQLVFSRGERMCYRVNCSGKDCLTTVGRIGSRARDETLTVRQ
jgi:hypothetical protein